MRRWICIVAVCGLSASCGANSWDRAVKDANEANQLLVVEFYATWCKPCQWFEREVLPWPAVQSELKNVTFRRFDFDSRDGRAHANRLGVRAIPTFLVVDRDGSVRDVMRGAVGRDRFLRFLRVSRMHLSGR